MKKIVTISILFMGLLLILFTISCEKTTDQNKEKLKSNELTPVENTNGIPHFVSAESFFETLAKINKMTESDRKKWESDMGFVSQRTLHGKLLSELDQVTTESELQNILNKNTDILKLSSDNEIVPVLDYGQFPFIVNRQGYFYVNNILHKVTQENTFIAKNPGITNLEQIFLEEGEKSDKVLVIKNNISVMTKNCGSSVVSPPLTEGNRRVKIYMSTRRAYVSDGYYYYCQDYVDWSVKGFRKVLGAWYSYNSIYYYQNVSFGVMTMVHSLYGKGVKSGELPEYEVRYGNYPGTEESPYEAWIYTWTEPIGEGFQFTDGYPAEVLNNPPSFSQVAGEGKSRGTSGWATISCGY